MGALVLGLGVAGAVGGTAAGAAPSGPRWVNELGTRWYQAGLGVAVDAANNEYVVGETQRTFPGSPTPSVGNDDAFLLKFNARGKRLWTRQFGSGAQDGAYAVAVDGLGNVDVVGTTGGTPSGSPENNAGHDDVFVSRFTADGDAVWTHLLGGPSTENGFAVAGDATGSVYVAGYTYDRLPGAPEALHGDSIEAFVAKYDTAGNVAWVHLIGTSGNEYADGLAVTPGGGVDVAGWTNGSFAGAAKNKGQTDVFVAHFDDDGTRSWITDAGTKTFDVGNALAVDSAGNAFVAGWTGALPGTPGDQDALVMEFDAGGALLRTTQLGSNHSDQAKGIAVDDADDVFITGSTAGTLPGSLESSAGDSDAFVARLDPGAGSRLRTAWVHQLGSAADDSAYAIAATPEGVATTVGISEGALPGSRRGYAGGDDLFVAQYGRHG
ncbi:MAG TPA: SBBP repeat-containing protein [Acidimicrobiia bacterium]|nr:SBBP repeat-containing protein [Acidimicrobiia bacterium]